MNRAKAISRLYEKAHAFQLRHPDAPLRIDPTIALREQITPAKRASWWMRLWMWVRRVFG